MIGRGLSPYSRLDLREPPGSQYVNKVAGPALLG